MTAPLFHPAYRIASTGSPALILEERPDSGADRRWRAFLQPGARMAAGPTPTSAIDLLRELVTADLEAIGTGMVEIAATLAEREEAHR